MDKLDRFCFTVINMQKNVFPQWLFYFQQQAKLSNERRLIVLAGEDEWASSLLRSIESFEVDKDSINKELWLIYGDSESITSNVSAKGYRDRLGTESNFVVFNQQQLTVDAFAALSGTIISGGVLFWVVGDIKELKQSNFFNRFLSLLNSSSEQVIIEQSTSELPLLEPVSQVADKALVKTINSIELQKLPYGCITQEQVSAVDAIIKVIKGKSKRPLVLTADRGRGKSSALAIACARLLAEAKSENKLHIIITAADFNSVKIFFKQLFISFPQGYQEGQRYIAPEGVVEFLAVDKLLKLKPKVSLVLVDEAAAIPVYLLEKLLFAHSRLVFSSTIHGYEGAGRGFTLKFQQTLTKIFPHWRSLHVSDPIRWRKGDPLEQLVFDTCLLNAELPQLSDLSESKTLSMQHGQFTFKHITGVELLENESLLKQIFAVLVTAHYQTKPSDVHMLLDNKQVQLVCLMSANKGHDRVVAVALLMNEGKYAGQTITETELQAVIQAKRRLRNNFIPQSLLTQCGAEKAFDYHYLRVMRIAVHPQLQQQGIGSLFLQELIEFSKAQGADFLASSFGATQPLLSFWLTAGFKLGRIGFTKDKASGEQSALVLKPLSENAEIEIRTINAEFYRQFDYLLVDEYKYLAPKLVALIQQHCPAPSLMALSQLDSANIEAFVRGYRQYSSCVYSLHIWLKQQLSKQLFTDDELNILICRVMQKHSVIELCNAHHLTGKKAFETALKQSITNHLHISD